MASSMQQAVMSPVTIHLADGNEYRMDKLGLDALCEFQDWINAQLGVKAGSLVSFDDTVRWMQSPRGMRWLLWRSMRVHHPALAKPEDAGRLFVSVKGMQRAVESIVDLGEPEEGSPESDPPPSPLTGARYAE